MILLRWMGRVRVLGVSVCVVRAIPIQIIRGWVRSIRRVLLGVLGRILGRGIRPVGIVLVGRAIRTRAGRPVVLNRGVVIVSGG